MTRNIMFVGVGGQGSLLVSRILGNMLVELGRDVKVSEVHGMAQRGGSVVTYVRYGDKVDSPLVEKGEADIIVAFEQLEALRWASHLKPGGKLLMNTQKISPMPVITGAAQYPEEIVDAVKAKAGTVIAVDAASEAKRIGLVKAVNVVMLGVLASCAGIEKEHWLEAVSKTVPARFLEKNLEAFESGYAAGVCDLESGPAMMS